MTTVTTPAKTQTTRPASFPVLVSVYYLGAFLSTLLLVIGLLTGLNFPIGGTICAGLIIASFVSMLVPIYNSAWLMASLVALALILAYFYAIMGQDPIVVGSLGLNNTFAYLTGIQAPKPVHLNPSILSSLVVGGFSAVVVATPILLLTSIITIAISLSLRGLPNAMPAFEDSGWLWPIKRATPPQS
jgi:hypothetical protein